MRKLLNVLIGWKMQLLISLFVLLSSVSIIAFAWARNLRQEVEYVSLLSEIALVSSALSSVIAALVFRELMTGPTMNDADREWMLKHLKR